MDCDSHSLANIDRYAHAQRNADQYAYLHPNFHPYAHPHTNRHCHPYPHAYAHVHLHAYADSPAPNARRCTAPGTGSHPHVPSCRGSTARCGCLAL